MINQEHGETKKKIISLTIADVIALIFSVVTVGACIGYYKTSIEELGELKSDVKELRTGVSEINLNYSTLKTLTDDLKENVRRIEDKLGK